MPKLIEMSASACADAIRRGDITAESAVLASLERIRQREPKVKAFNFIDYDGAIRQAKQRDQQTPSGPLHGVPIAVKDLFDTADMPTTYGSELYSHHRPVFDAAAVALARAAGAVVVGKSFTTEFGSLAPVRSRNPHDLSRTPGFSSSGSAAAVADFMVPLSLGTQTGGSILSPAALCGVVGFKPSSGAIPIMGVKHQAPSLDTIGVFGRSVSDVSLFASVLARKDWSMSQPFEHVVQIGICDLSELSTIKTYVIETFKRAIDKARGQRQFEFTKRPLFAPLAKLNATHRTIMTYEAAHNLASEYASSSMRMAKEVREMLEAGQSIPDSEYQSAQIAMQQARSSLPAFFGNLDAIMLPTIPGEAPLISTNNRGDSSLVRIWTLAGVPSITLPFGHGESGMPLGIQLVAPAGHEAKLLRVAAALECILSY